MPRLPGAIRAEPEEAMQFIEKYGLMEKLLSYLDMDLITTIASASVLI
jgi:hypothetical protein